MHSSYPPSQPPPPASAALLSGLGQALRWLREKQSRKQYRVADSAGITKGMLSAYETGRQRPSLETLAKLLETLGCDLNDLHNALQIVNGRPEWIKGWRGWQTAGWLAGARDREILEAPISDTSETAGILRTGAPDARTFLEIREPAPPYGSELAPSPGKQALDPPSHAAELYRVLGRDRPSLAAEEERALGQMLDGFHSLLRYWHRSLAKGR